MKNSFPGSLFIIFVLVTTAVCELGLRRTFHSVLTRKKWQKARDHCRDRYTDLATIRSQEEADHLPSLVNNSQYWFGLHRDTRDPAVWRWTELVQTPVANASEYTSWVYRNQSHSENCTYMGMKNKGWHRSACSRRLFFVCSAGGSVVMVTRAASWEEAQQDCGSRHQSLATITAENKMMLESNQYNLWIGLFRDVDDEWKWVGETQPDFRNWAPGEPDKEHCGFVTYKTPAPATKSFSWQSGRCRQKKFFLCYEEKLVLVRENKTWEEALEFCRTLALNPRVDPAAYRNHRYDLASLLSDDDHLYAREKIMAAVTDEVWTGLRFLAGRWLWVNGDELRHRGPPLRPSRRQHCGTLPKDRARPWEVRDCRDRRNFLCFQRK